MIDLRHGDCREVLATLPADSVHCVVTSPPYYGLRDYGTAQWAGGDVACGHVVGRSRNDVTPERLAERAALYGTGTGAGSMVGSMQARHECPHCGAIRTDSQIGLEATPDAYIAQMVEVFRLLRRVLRDDGTLWLNLGSSYSTGKGSNVTDQLNRLLEGGSVFFADASPGGVAGHGVGVALHDERAPDSELAGLLAAQGNGVEQRHQDLGEIADLFTGPGRVGAGPAVLGMAANIPDAKVALDKREHRSIIRAQGDAQPETIFAVLRPTCACAGEDDETAFAIHQADEPCIRGNVRWHSAWHTFASNAVGKGSEDVHLVDQAIALGNRPQTLAGLLCDFRITKASEQQVTLTSIHGGLSLAISDVGQLWFVLRCGSVVPYSRLHADASRSANALLPKQDLGMPWRVARALQEDGWILRSPIIWHKPNPMPESVTDRPTSAHEHVFLLAKNARYFYDADAVRETAEYGYSPTPQMFDGVGTGTSAPSRKFGSVQQGSGGSRNCRNVWTIATAPFSAAHFATFPPALAERCIRAGTSERGCCAACGAPWGRVVDRIATRAGVTGGATPYDSNRPDGMTLRAGGFGDGSSTTTGWAPSCKCASGDPVPATVLDCFAGAGTTLLVADRLQRDAIGIELNPSYTEMAMQRCRDDAPLFASPPPAEPPEDARMRDLFTEAAQ